MNLPEDEPKKGAPEWVVTFGDMMSLLLCFFVLLLSFSTMEMAKRISSDLFIVEKQKRST